MTPTDPRESSEPRKLEFKDAVVWRSPHVADAQTVEIARDLAAKTGKLAIVLGPEETIESLDEDQMRECGWVRAEVTDEMVDRAADVAYGVYHPATQPRFTGKERAWRGPMETNPMRRAVQAAIQCFVAAGQKQGDSS